MFDNETNDQIEPISGKQMSKDELLNFISGFPGLLWRIEMVKNRIEFLNNYQIKCLGSKSEMLMKDINFSRRVILEEDFYLFEAFARNIRNGHGATTVFRIRTEDGGIHWLRIVGTVDQQNPLYYMGCTLEITDTVAIVQTISDRNAEFQAMIERAYNPVILVDLVTKSVIAPNAAATDLFGYKPREFHKLVFSDLYHKSINHYINRIYEKVVCEKKWEGKMIFHRKNHSTFSGEVVMHTLPLKGRWILRVSIHNVNSERSSERNLISIAELDTASSLKQTFYSKLMEKVQNSNNIIEILQILLDNQYSKQQFSSIMFSDIYAKKNKVVVYTAGDAFKPMKQGETFPYEGTIAENIERFKLNHLIVENTFSSIKPIDWALFIPHGVRSYFAKAFYERKVMRTVLILCSCQPNMFSEEQTDDYALLYTPFLCGLKNWRQAEKERKRKQR